MNFKDRLSILGAAVLLAAPLSVAGQGTTPSGGTGQASPAPNKVAVVDIRQAVQSTAEGKQASAELQSQFASKQTELENLRKNIEELQNRLSTGARTLSDEERTRLERQGERMARHLQRKQEEYQEEANGAQQDAFDRMGRKMVEVISRFARENGYGVILDASQACGVYCSNQLDVTQEIIRLYDQANPVKASGTTSPTTPPRQTLPVRPPQTPPQTPPAKPKP